MFGCVQFQNKDEPVASKDKDEPAASLKAFPCFGTYMHMMRGVLLHMRLRRVHRMMPSTLNPNPKNARLIKTSCPVFLSNDGGCLDVGAVQVLFVM